MKTITLFIAFITASAALLTNPGEEDPYIDEITGASIERSRVLSGFGPQEANDRHFDWDESCTNKDHRKKIVTAFNAMQQLVTSASGKLQELRNNLPQQPSGIINNENRRYIARTDFAYTQMFRARDNNIDDARQSFDRLTDNVKNLPGRAAADEGALRFICNADNHVKSGSDLGGSPLCGDANDKSTRAQAITHVPQDADGGNIEQKYSFTKSSSITFCPAFFDDTDFLNLEDIIGFYNTQILPLDKVNCRERILLHEYMHLPWVDDLKPPNDKIGYLKVAVNAKENREWAQIANQPDAFAWYALYSYFNNVEGGCRDAWPPRQKKPVVIA
ncbi:hypothetical protein Q7P36_009416 [Cladosporium allicinum]